MVAAGGAACPVHEGTETSNACIKFWFDDGDHSLAGLLAKDDAAKVKGRRRIAFQRAEVEGGPCGRTFEDAFMLANAAMFAIEGATPNDQARCALAKLNKVKKSDFALKFAIEETDWAAPGYILDGLRWLAAGGIVADEVAIDEVVAGDALETAVGRDG